MTGLSSVIVALHLLAALVLIAPATDALTCHDETETCDQKACLDNEGKASSSKEEKACAIRSGMFLIAADTMVYEMAKSLEEEGAVTKDEAVVLGREVGDTHAAIFYKFKDSDSTDKSEDNAFCSRVALTGTLKLPSGKTIVKSVSFRFCTFGNPECQDINGVSKSGNYEVQGTFCSRKGNNSNSKGGNIVASKVLLLAPFILMGLTALLAVPTLN